MKLLHRFVFNLKVKIFFKLHVFSQYLFELSIEKTQELLKDDRYKGFIKELYIKGKETQVKLK